VKKLLSRSSSRRAVAGVCLLLIALLLVRPQAERVRWRVSQSVSLALGKQVQIGSLHLRFLPRLGFELEDFVIYDDASVGSEPLLRAQDVSASLRVTSLLRGRFEISSLALNNVSLNLSRDLNGKWNLQDLLQRTGQISMAPTASARRESRPEFPYIEATRARINFKVGAEKTHFALTEAQFALWQESEDVWGMRLKAQPIRTDANLTDTGVINVSGRWRRAGSPGKSPIEFGFEWKQAQAGQVSKLISGADKGWRGGVLISGSLSGTSRNLKIVADASIDDLGRYDVFNDDDLHLAGRCVANYNLAANSFSDVDCASPAGGGSLELKGSATGLPFSSFSFTLVGNQLPAPALLSFLRHTTAGVSEGLNVNGVLDSTVEIVRTRADQPVQWTGDGALRELTLTSSKSSPPLLVERVPFTVVSRSENDDGSQQHEHAPRIDAGPVSVSLGRTLPLQAHASLSFAGYRAWVRGDAGVKRLLQVAPLLGIPVPVMSADGSSNVDLQISGTWAEGAPRVTGTAQLRNVRAQVRGLNAPLDLRNASLTLVEDNVRVQNINAAVADSQWRGSMVIPRPCPTPRDCVLQFNLHAGEVNAATLNTVLNPSARKQSWYKFLSLGGTPLSYFLQTHATGKVSIEKFTMGSSSSTQLSGDVTLDQGKLTVANFRSTVLSGKIAGEWRADFLTRPPIYRGSGNMEEISLGQISDLMQDGWVEGTGTAHYEFKTAGWGLQDIIANADLSATFAIEGASFPHVILTSKAGPLRVKTLSGKLILQDGKFSLQDAKLDSTDSVYTVSGTASLAGALSLKMASEGPTGYDLSGTLTRTRVSQFSTTSARASLKP
jgi:AsmA family/AsmA-like C-terminal region